MERFAGWNRRERLIYEGGVGCVRVYPNSAGTFDQVGVVGCRRRVGEHTLTLDVCAYYVG